MKKMRRKTMIRVYGQRWITAMLMTVVFIIIIISGNSIAQEAVIKEEPQQAQKGELQVPEERKYLVKEGDTLWDISTNIMKDPFLWPRLWKDNKYIINPDLIYPGNVIILPGEEIVIKEAEPVTAPLTAPKEAEPIKKAEEVPPPADEEAAPPAEKRGGGSAREPQPTRE